MRELALVPPGDRTGPVPPHVRDLLARIAVDEMYELVVLLRPDGTVLDGNVPAVRAGGAPLDAVVGHPCWEASVLGSRESRERLRDGIRRAAAGEFVRWEMDLAVAPSAPPVALDVSLRPVRDAAGAVVLIVAEGRDVTPLRRARELLQQELEGQAEDVERLAGELGRRKRELETALDAMRFAREQADRANAQKTGLLRLVSHELRTPLSAILLQVDRLRRDAAELSPAHRDAVGRMRSATQRLTGLVESLLEFARMEAGRVTLEPELLDAARVAGEALEELRPHAQAKGLELAGPAPGTVPHLETDARLLRLVLLNLVSNGIKFTDAGSVTVSIAADGEEHHIAVRDTGRGVAPADQTRIFEPFEQLEEIARKHTPGIGLGLALVREMVFTLGGRIRLESALGEGSTFTVTLPSRRRAADRGAVQPR
ncbi:MAG TPA: HAMP domain-containing sensor histidine kinase [Anaeromyxobacter sp.]|nr:HAMP domain-containing sensor histidine kinase [Anaeromyxobacter sp.]